MSTLRLSIVAFMFASTALVSRATQSKEPITVDLARLPYGISGEVPLQPDVQKWTGRDAAPLDEKITDELRADAYLNRTYANGGGAPVGLYVAFYGAQRPGVSIHSPLHCLPGTGWEPIDVDTIDIASERGSAGHVRRMVVRKGADRSLVLYWYAVHGRIVASEAVSKLWLLHDAVRLGRSDAALVRIAVPVTDSVETAERRALAFTRDLIPYLSHLWS